MSWDSEYSTALRQMGELLVRGDRRSPTRREPPEGDRGRILPMISGLLEGKQALRERRPGPSQAAVCAVVSSTSP